jgi:hypothetical protein
VALLEWLPLGASELRAVGAGLEGDRPACALAAIVRPPTIWTTSEALAAASMTHVGHEHLARLRATAARLEQQLLVAGFAAASAAVARACAALAADDDAGAAVARTVLARYAASAFVAARRREAVPTMI